ncbi:MAG: KilA-N domain-containing protein [Bacteroidetes bacterium]|nr:KilA-N domain-containing protein [Bacteroidota bacterium]
MKKNRKIIVKDTEITIIYQNDNYYISLINILKVKDGDFFISDRLRNRNTVEFLGIWETINNPSFNYGEFAIIKSHVGRKVGFKYS